MYEARLEIAQDYQQMQSGAWHLKRLTSTRYSELVFYMLTVVLSYPPYHLSIQKPVPVLLTRHVKRSPLNTFAAAGRLLLPLPVAILQSLKR